ncbi:MAG: beta-1,6-N-acetylglucosaminyltransferase [Puia sp.]|nr:beta-1,6-N-acetylglucosaminyltransferase [Puia sp.]
MRIANVLFVHKDAKLVERQIFALEHQDFDFYLHVDKKSNFLEFQGLSELPNTQFVSRRAVMHWGGFGFIRAIIQSLEDVLNSGKQYDFVNLLTGQDYPIKKVSYIYDFFSANIGKSFLTYETPPSLWWNQSMQRFRQYHMTDYSFKGRTRIEQFLTAVLPPRKFPLPYKLYGGPCASYWTISMDAAVYLYEFLKTTMSRKQRMFFKHTWGSDEFLISTVLLNSPFKDSIVNNNQRYIDWTMGGAHPKIITMADVHKLERSGRLFARKFDSKIDAQVLDYVDTHLLGRDTAGSHTRYAAQLSQSQGGAVSRGQGAIITL